MHSEWHFKMLGEIFNHGLIPAELELRYTTTTQIQIFCHKSIILRRFATNCESKHTGRREEFSQSKINEVGDFIEEISCIKMTNVVHEYTRILLLNI